MRILSALALLALVATPASACGPEDPGGRCEVEGGYYIAAPPSGWDGKSPLGLVVYFHGWNASPEGTMRNRAMVNGVHREGALFVAPWARTGYWRQIGEGRAEPGRDEDAYIRAVMADVRRRWPIDERLTLASGFSRGASMVWNVACYAGELFAAYAPIAGGFWNTTPETCPSGPVRLRHIHGTADRVVAYDVRGIYNSRPIPEGLEVLLEVADHNQSPATANDPRLACSRWGGADGASVIEVCLHEKGHSIPAEWVADGYRWMRALSQ